MWGLYRATEEKAPTTHTHTRTRYTSFTTEKYQAAARLREAGAVRGYIGRICGIRGGWMVGGCESVGVSPRYFRVFDIVSAGSSSQDIHICA